MAQFVGYSGPILLLPEAFRCHMTDFFFLLVPLSESENKTVLY